MNISHDELQIIASKKCHWFCPSCEKPAFQAIATDIDIEQRCDEYMKKMTERVEKIEANVENEAGKTELEQAKAEINSAKSDMLAYEVKIRGLSTDLSTLNEKINLVRS